VGVAKYLTSMRFGRTRSTSDKNQPLVELSLMTTSSPSLGIFPLTCRDGVFIPAAEVLDWNDERDVAFKRLPLVLQLELTPTWDCCHGRGTMIVHKVFGLASLGSDFLLRWRFIPLENYERCSVHKRSERLSEICFRRTWHVRFGKHGRATYKPPYPNNEDLQVWKWVLNIFDLDEMLLIRIVKIDAEGKLDEASLRLAAQLSISHEKLETIEDEIDMASLMPNLFLSSLENLWSCVACSRLLSRDYIVAQDSNGASDSHFPVD
jgi:hypothetical protein